MFSQADLFQIQQKGITLDQVNQQLEYFKKGFPYLKLIKPAVQNDGVITLNVQEKEQLIAEFEAQKSNKKLIKFVPASGAATRMFKSMIDHLTKPSNALLPGDVGQVIGHLELFAFYDDLKKIFTKNGLSLDTLRKDGLYHNIIKFIINEEGLNYGKLPKCLLKFHNYPEGTRTSLEEHLVEGALYAQNFDRSVDIYFTVSPEHIQPVSKLIEEVKKRYEMTYHVIFNIVLSIQKSCTDTIAMDGNNFPFRNSNGSLLFRPGGHGALLENLNDIEGDIIFIKNIDNVVPDRLKSETILYKKTLAGLLLKLQKHAFDYLNKFENASGYDKDLNAEVVKFIESGFGYRFSPAFVAMTENKQTTLLVKLLDRPIRVCGMVQNTDEPGGGPYWVENSDGSLSLQILELSQINLDDEQQRQIFKNATHFNPVDLVVAIRDYKGRKYNLTQFRDPDTGFITTKSKDSKELKALELPGLWNGAMAFWNTVFVEVPLITFNPVKTINDLLRIEHQNY
jgi:hypothetical protein